MQVQSLGWEDPLEKGVATHSSILAWRFLWTEEPGGLQVHSITRIRHNLNGLACSHCVQHFQELATYLFIYLLYLLKKIIYLATLGLSYSMQAPQLWWATVAAPRHVGAQFPEQGSNPPPMHGKGNSFSFVKIKHSIYFFLIINFIVGHTGSSFLCGGFLQLWRVRVTLQVYCMGFSLWGLLLLWSTGSRHTGSVSAAHGLSSFGWWSLNGSGIGPRSPALTGKFLPIVSPEKSRR